MNAAMISPDSITWKSCGGRFNLIASDFVVLAETLRLKLLKRQIYGRAKYALSGVWLSSSGLSLLASNASAFPSIKLSAASESHCA
jgi:hypothetical protein